MGLNREGFKRRTYEEILEDMSARAKNSFGQDANVSEKSVLGILIRIVSWFLAMLWQDTEDVYHSGYRKSAEGVQLDMLLPFAGITRRLAEPATGRVRFYGDAGTQIPAGFYVSTAKDALFYTLYSVTIGANGQVDVDAMAEEPGSLGNAGMTVNQIVNPTLGITSVETIVAFENGRDTETDKEARERADLTVEGLGSGTTAAIHAELLRTDNVRGALIIENFNDTMDQFGTPPRAIQAYVLGGSDEDVARAIHKKKAAGVQPFGTTQIVVKDASSNDQFIGFTRATEYNVHMKAEITVDSNFPSDGADKVKDALVEYVGGIKTDSRFVSGLTMGEKVIHSKAAMNAFRVDGVQDVELQLSVDGINFNEENIIVNINEVAQINANNIEVIVHVQY